MKTTFSKARNLFLPAFLLVSGLGFSQYCTPDPMDCSDNDAILNVTFANINNDSDCDSFDGYNDLTAITANVSTGNTYTLTVTVGDGGDEIVGAYLDFNGNGIFEESEFIYIGNVPGGGGTVSTTVTIPADAYIGTTRLRVRTVWNMWGDEPETFYLDGGDGACVDPSIFGGYGETEDYSVNISEGTPCVGTPEIGPISASETTVCASTPLTITAIVSGNAVGFSYQLQASTDGGDTWVNVGAAQATGVFNVNQSEASIYRVVVTCVGSGESDTSDTVSVAQNPLAECFCAPTANNPLNCTDGDIVTNVTFETINNDSDCGANGYTDYTATIPAVSLEAGESYPISVTVGPSGDGWLFESVGVWIDYDHNGVFSEDEFTYVGTGLDETLSGTITIPDTALNGEARMRVITSATQADAFTWEYACSPLNPNNNFGEMEDYLVNITNPLANPNFANGLTSIYPNPVQDVVNISVKNGVSLKSAEVYNITGQKVAAAEFAASAEGQINLNSLSAGAYILKITTDQGVSSERLIKK